MTGTPLGQNLGYTISGYVVLHRGPRLHSRRPQPTIGDKTQQTNRQIWCLTVGLWCFVTYCWSSAPWKCYIMVELIKNMLCYCNYCCCFTRFWRPRVHDRVFVYTVAASLNDKYSYVRRNSWRQRSCDTQWSACEVCWIYYCKVIFSIISALRYQT